MGSHPLARAKTQERGQVREMNAVPMPTTEKSAVFLHETATVNWTMAVHDWWANVLSCGYAQKEEAQAAIDAAVAK